MIKSLFELITLFDGFTVVYYEKTFTINSFVYRMKQFQLTADMFNLERIDHTGKILYIK